MSASCPNCGSRYLNLARFRSAGERFDAVLGTRPLRCGDCHTRFIGRIFVWQDLRFSKCPKCYRMDLNLWREEHYQARGWMAFLLRLGGKRMRCEYCRLNFVSLRNRKEHFTFSRWTRQQAVRDSDSHEHSPRPTRSVSSGYKAENRSERE